MSTPAHDTMRSDSLGVAPWPEMRHDRRNTGSSPVRAHYRGDRPWSHRTGRGIFTTPVIDADGAIYIGSADRCFYAFEPDGAVRWSYESGGIIDSAALIGNGQVSVGSGDGFLYRFNTGPNEKSGVDRLQWRFAARSADGSAQQVSWWEGNVAAGPDDLVLAGNTAGHIYALDGDGHEKWSFTTGNAVWSAAAVGDDGTSYWGSLDFCVYALDRNGRQQWSTPTLGFVVSSPALSLEGTLYVGSFDGNLYALDAATGDVRWTFQTNDNIYSSPALLEIDGATHSVVVGSTDGTVIALSPNGELRWRYDTGAVVRSSPAISSAPDGEGTWIVYIGAADGVLYALDALHGTRRWSFDTTMDDPALADRNSLNGSPALGTTGVHIASEDGSVWYVPYDYPLHHHDSRGSTEPSEPFEDDVQALFVVSPGGATLRETDPLIGPAAAVTLRLIVRDGGATIDAEMDDDFTVIARPEVALRWRRSGDGHFVFVVPEGFWPADSHVDLEVRSGWHIHQGAKESLRSGRIDQGVRIRIASSDSDLMLDRGDDATSALQLRRLAFALPSFAPSVNQIGFDSYDWLIGTLEVVRESERTGRVLFFVHGASRNELGVWEVDRASPFAFPMEGRYEGNALSISANGVDLPFSFANVPTDRLDLRFQLDDHLDSLPGASMYGEVVCADIPFYGPLLADFTRLPDSEGRMTSSGTFLISRPDLASTSPRRPGGLEVLDVRWEPSSLEQPGRLNVLVSGDTTAHVFSVVWLDGDTGDLAAGRCSKLIDARSESGATRLTFERPGGVTLPTGVEALVVVGIYPLARVTLG